jgi:hypothetical protein
VRPLSTCFIRWKRHRFDAIAVGIDHERRVVFHAIVRTKSGRAIGAASGIERSGVKGINIGRRFRAQTDVDAALRFDRLHAGAKVDPEFGIGFAEADGRRARYEARQAERRQRCFIEAH